MRRVSRNADATDAVHHLTEDLSVRDIVEIFDQVAHRRNAGDHAWFFDSGVRRYIQNLLRSQLRHQREEVIT